jgi:universal stress protein A
MLKIKTILHPTDHSKSAEHALAFAGALARDYGAHLLLLHVLPEPDPVAEFVSPSPPTDYADLAQQAFHELEAVAGPMPEKTVDSALIVGDVAKSIVKVAIEKQVDLIVMGSHGRTGLKRLLLGSIAEEVLRHAPCPVLTLTSPAALKDER